MAEKKFPRLAYNPISTIGILIALVTALIMTFLYILDVFASDTNPYLGIFLYMVMPVFLVLGLLLIPLGMIRQWRRWKKTGREDVPSWPRMDLNDKSQRNAALIFFVGTILFLGMSAIGSYQAFHFSESVTFCGKICHSVMKPEYVAYQNSPHARVACVECHVGPGADWYAKSKLSGAYQVYAVMADVYPRPIETPVANLRPAQETCEQCHWPDKFFGGQQRQFNHYRYDEENSHWPIDMLIKVGGANIRSGEATDIHWHVNPSMEVQYIARDEKREDIPWVRVLDLTDSSFVVYENEDDPLDPDLIDSLEIRTMDCVDCHNRPSHIYNSPDHAIDMALSSGLLDPDLPEIKMVAVEAMAAEYETEEEALTTIENQIRNFYKENYSELYESESEMIDQAVSAVQREFSNNIFPEMKVKWSEYPNHIGHFEWAGCMRCHEGSHLNDKDEPITHECNSCHIILAQGSGDRRETASHMVGLEFQHPEDIDEAWMEMGCQECHSGTQP